MSTEKLNVGDFGDKIARLHATLKGQAFEISTEEIKRKFFGPSTREAVCESQKRYGLEVTGEVDEATAATLSTSTENHPAPSVSSTNHTGPARFAGELLEPLVAEPRPEEITEGVYIAGSEQTAPEIQGRQELQTGGIADQEAAAPIKRERQDSGPDSGESLVVEGRVVYADGRALADGLVRAFDKDLRSEEQLGETNTDKNGRYRIHYSAKQFRRAEKDSADLIIRAYGLEGRELASSPILFNAQPMKTVDLTIGDGEYRGFSEFELLQQEITPLLDGLPLADLTEGEDHQDVTFLTGETGLPFQHIEFLAQSARLANQTEMPPEVFYAFARQDLSIATLPGILRQNPEALHHALEAALADNIIPARLRSSLPDILNRLQEFAVTEELEGESSTGALLRTSPILAEDRERQRVFIEAYRQYEGPSEPFWKEFAEKNSELVDEDVIQELRLTMELGALAQDHLPMVQRIQNELRQNGIAPDLRELANWELSDWHERIKTTGIPPNIPGETREARTANYAQIVYQAVEVNFPTAVIAHRLKNERENLPNLSGATALLEVLDRDPDFDLDKANIDIYLGQDADRNLKADLKSWQRAYRVSPPNGRYEVMRALKMEGLDSAQIVAHKGHAAFINQYSEVLGGIAKAESVWNKASQVNAMVLGLITEFGANFNALLPQAIPSPAVEEVEGIANWKALFGSLDFCACEHCKSVYGPAAYFVDLLHFLQNASKKGERSPLTALLSRRPDLTEIELSCENTNTLMPYVDLVNEVLENALTWFKLAYSKTNLDDIALKKGTDGVISKSELGDALHEKFEDAGHRLSQAAKLSIVHKDNQWRVIDGPTTYVILLQNPDQHLVYHLLKNQTRATQDELSALPEHLNEQAYVRLVQAIYPWILPFDLWFEESRLYFKHLGFKRSEWMEKLLQSQSLKLLDVACDSLGMTTLERELITDSTSQQEDELWGLGQQQDWSDKLRGVRLFLWQAGFDEEVEGQNFLALRHLLIGTRYVNTDGTILISVDVTCDLDKARIENDKNASSGQRRQRWEAILNRARRFLRLQRKFGWTIPELDKAITAFNANLDGQQGDTFLQQLSHVERLRVELKVPLIEMFSWWGTIDTAEDRTEAEKSKKEESLYEQIFLNKTVDKQASDIFALNDKRTDLSISTIEKITSHTDSVVAALAISVADLTRLVQEDNLKGGEVPDLLTLENLSHLYRIVSLSKALNLSIKEFLAAKAFSGINPFKDTESTRKFVGQVQKIQASSFSITELDYLLRHRYEVSDDVAPIEEEIVQVINEIRRGLIKIEAETAGAPDSEGKLTGQRLALLLDPEDAQRAVAMLGGHAVYTASLPSLPKSITPLSKSVKQKNISYDAETKQLRFIGVMTKDNKNMLAALSGDKDYKQAIEAIFEEPRGFIERKMDAFLDVDDAIATLLDQPSMSSAKKFTYVLTRLNVYLRQTLCQNLVKQKLSTALNLDAETTELLVTTLVQGQLDKNKPALEDFLALSTSGLSGEYYANATFSGKPAKQQLDPTIDFRWTKNPLKNAPDPNSFSGSWRGEVQVEQNGTYTFHVQSDAGAELWINNQKIVDVSTIPQGTLDADKKIKLEAGQYYDIDMRCRTNKGTGTVKLSWTPPSTPKQVVPASKLVPSAIVASCRTSYHRLHKLAMLITKFKLKPDELNYLSDHSIDFQGFDVNKFPINASSSQPTLFKQWEQLYDVCTFGAQYSQHDIRLIDVFGDAYTSVDEAKKSLLALTGWEEKAFNALAGSKGFQLSADDFKQGRHFLELHEGFRLLRQLGISAQELIDWTTTDLGASFTDTQDTNFKIKKSLVQALRRVVKAKYSQKKWLNIAKPLRDGLRDRQRTALVAYLVYDYGLKDINELYDRFLIDVEMSPCMLTSRLKQAIGAVQLFVQRSLMSLEPGVELSPQSAKEWKWRKYYRVWEANRKVFLYPENWIEPELRDDKSPFFEDLENELLQNEITKDTAETAFLNYLEKLDEVARLEIVGMYEQEDGMYEQKENRTTTSVLHVIGRTRIAPHVYYYRRWIDASYWTPWERVDVDIEGDHLIPVVWNRRLHLFWPNFREKAQKKAPNDKDKHVPMKLEIQLAWSEYKNGKWSAKKIASEASETYTISETSGKLPSTSEITFKAQTTKKGELTIIGYTPVKKFWKEDGITGFYLYWQPSFKLQFGGCKGRLSKSTTTPPLSNEKLMLPGRSAVDAMTFLETKEVTGEFEDNSLKLANKYSGSARNLVLKETPGKFRILYPHQYTQFISQSSFFYQDDTRTFFVIPGGGIIMRGGPGSPGSLKSYTHYSFRPFYHPFVCEFMQQLNRYGIDGLLDPDPAGEGYALYRQMGKKPEFFAKDYLDNKPTMVVDKPYPIEDIDFSTGGAYSRYNWELFFHAPLLIADRLSNNQRFEEAMQWFHYIFDPAETSGSKEPARSWKVCPFYEPYTKKNGKPKRIQELMQLLNKGDEKWKKLVEQWQKDPFKPHLIARQRTAAYMKTVIMKYLDNLIAWGDQLFRRDTMESNIEAAQLYILAANILGDRPEAIPPKRRKTKTGKNLTFSDLGKLDAFSNADIENLLLEATQSGAFWANGQQETLTLPHTLYFCIPNNKELLKYWDTVEDRLFKIRHCMNIKGVVRQLPLFQPPIDPALLVRAAAAGIDISSVLNDLYAPLPHYRFQVMLQKASELCAEVRSLGAALLSTLEKKDAEELALMRSRHELQLLKAVRQIKKQQIEEAEEALAGLKKASALVTKRKMHYETLKKNGLNAYEKSHLSKLSASHTQQYIGQGFEIGAAVAHYMPTTTYTTGSMGSHFSTSYGGNNIGYGLQAIGRFFSLMASIDANEAALASIEGSHERRAEEWQLQIDLATIEAEQIDEQIKAAETRQAIAENELNNHDLQAENAKEMDTYMRNKFTNKQLYNWMVSQISALYFQSYQLAYDLAKRAEKTFQYELAVTDTNYIQFGYWDSLKKGLLAGEKLHYDLKRMEVAYLEQNEREYEITKHISLTMLHPEALLMLRETGECYVHLPEAFFDLDYPGHYMRRIKSVSLTIPCVTGPYTNVSCTLTLQSNRIRKSTSTSGTYAEYAWSGDTNDDRFIYNTGATQSIATSNAKNDSGVFELNFRDERYLPFEGAGVISTWHIELPNTLRQFDYDTISDVVIHLQYTAREGGATFKKAVEKKLTAAVNKIWIEEGKKGLSRLWSAKQEFPNEWNRFFQLIRDQGGADYKHKLQLDLSIERFPYQFRSKTITPRGMTLFLKLKKEITEQSLVYDLKRGKASQIQANNQSKKRNQFEIYVAPDGKEIKDLLFAQPFENPVKSLKDQETWSFEVKENDIPDSLAQKVTMNKEQHSQLDPKEIEDLLILCEYSV